LDIWRNSSSRGRIPSIGKESTTSSRRLLNGVLDEKLNLDETHLFLVQFVQKMSAQFFPPEKNTANGKNEF